MTTPRYRFSASRVQRGVRRMDVLFSADDRQEYLDLLSQSASKHALDFLAGCLMSHHAHFVGVPRQERSLARTFGEAHCRFCVKVGGVLCGRSASILIRWTNGKVWGHSLKVLKVSVFSVSYLPSDPIDASFSSISGAIWPSYSTNTCRLPPCKSHFPLSLSA